MYKNKINIITDKLEVYIQNSQNINLLNFNKTRNLNNLRDYIYSYKELNIDLINILIYELLLGEDKLLKKFILKLIKNLKNRQQEVKEIYKNIMLDILDIKIINDTEISKIVKSLYFSSELLELYLKDFNEESIKFLLKKIIIINEYFLKILKNLNFLTFKQMDLLINNFKILHFPLRYKNIIGILYDEIIKNIVEFYKYPEKINKEILLNISHFELNYYNLNNIDIKLFFKININEDINQFNLVLLAKINAYILIYDNFSVNEDIIYDKTLIIIIKEISMIANSNIKQLFFKVIQNILLKFNKFEKLSINNYNKGNLTNEILNIIINNWEVHIKGLGNLVNDCFKFFLKSLKNLNDKSIYLTILDDILINKFINKNIKNVIFTSLLDYIPINSFINKFENIINYCLCNFYSLYENSGVKLLEKILFNLYKYLANKNNFRELWVDFWLKNYIDHINKDLTSNIQILNELFIPEVLKITDEIGIEIINNYLNKKILYTNENYLDLYVSVLIYSRKNGLLINNKSNYIFKNKQLEFDYFNLFNKLILSYSKKISQNILKIVILPRKLNWKLYNYEFKLVLRFIKYNFKTSYPDFRNENIILLRNFLQRIKNNYKNIILDYCNDKIINDDIRNLNKFFEKLKLLFIKNNYPGSPFESSFPYIELIKNVYFIFSELNINNNYLDHIGYYDKNIIYILLNNFNSQWESTRRASFETLKIIISFIKHFDCNFYKELGNKANNISNNFIIKNIELGSYCFCLNYISKNNIDSKINIWYNIFDLIKKNYNILKENKFEFKYFLGHTVHGYLSYLNSILQLKEDIQNIYNYNIEIFFKISQNIYQVLLEIIDIITNLFEYSDKIFINNENFDEGKLDNENLILIYLYLLLKESGKLFKQFVEIIFIKKSLDNIVKYEDIKNLISKFWNILLNIKHYGSIDIISNSIEILCKSFYNFSENSFKNIINFFINEILNNWKNDNFKNTLRRSSGLPFAIIALLKSEISSNQNLLMKKCLNSFFEIINNINTKTEIKIHSWNIMKFIFEDSILKEHSEYSVGEAIKLAIIGFSDNNWKIRNSSLMLYSSLVKRIFQIKNIESNFNKSNLNIFQFFLKLPSLYSFFINEIDKFKNNKECMYPTLYPICLILSKLLPFDVKDLNDEKNKENIEDLDINNKRKLTYNDINKILNALIKVSNIKNYFGRILIAKATIPFININNYFWFFKEIFPSSNNIIINDHNQYHGKMLICYYTLKSLNIYDYNDYNSIFEYVFSKNDIFKYNKNSFIKIIYLKILGVLINKADIKEYKFEELNLLNKLIINKDYNKIGDFSNLENNKKIYKFMIKNINSQESNNILLNKFILELYNISQDNTKYSKTFEFYLNIFSLLKSSKIDEDSYLYVIKLIDNFKHINFVSFIPLLIKILSKNFRKNYNKDLILNILNKFSKNYKILKNIIVLIELELMIVCNEDLIENYNFYENIFNSLLKLSSPENKIEIKLKIILFISSALKNIEIYKNYPFIIYCLFQILMNFSQDENQIIRFKLCDIFYKNNNYLTLNDNKLVKDILRLILFIFYENYEILKNNFYIKNFLWKYIFNKQYIDFKVISGDNQIFMNIKPNNYWEDFKISDYLKKNLNISKNFNKMEIIEYLGKDILENEINYDINYLNVKEYEYSLYINKQYLDKWYK